MFQDSPGIFPPLSWDGKQLKKELESVGATGKPCYYPWKVLTDDHETNYLRYIGNSLIDLICPSEDDDDDEEHERGISSSRTSRPLNSSSSKSSNNLTFEDIFCIFRDVATPKETRQAVRLMLVFNTRSFKDLSK